MNNITKHLFTAITGRSRQGSGYRQTHKKTITIILEKREKFVIGVLLLSALFFLIEFQFNRYGLLASLLISLFSDFILWWAIRKDLVKGSPLGSLSVFVLPFFYTLAFGLFYFLVPARLLSRIILTVLYAIGLYSLYLCQNIFVVGATRTIQLLSGAKIVSFILTLLSFFFLTNTVFSLHLPIYLTLFFLCLFTYFLLYQSLWMYTLQTERSLVSHSSWVAILTFCIAQVAFALWFWPSSPTVIAIFLTGIFYTITGLSHIWFERRLFRGVLWEYVWVSAIVFFILVLATSWGK